ncbi:type VI secretion system-associated protein TagF [Thiocystis violascens]|uniref:Type VI secretion-associated protein, BMA_A0400 family n=1 Tax=Thiocystis violascens (strain ATCC 17096 / DSM 198 / 6111) TaxID=765911 RepID=I3YB82_THIV6|nr:type VI secretion system-associated protein TagF [Thiocystis violascens]AFL74250.1 type VI secretion-associated protein, BMA_A0400 family [Thiocystis violascens DSM 198]
MNDRTDHTPGFYGKLPELGDFVSRRAPGEFVRPWDLWLRESLASSRAQLGEDWLDIYLTSPLWRFVLTPGIAGQSAWAGILMPSVDRVGRYFPLTLACPLNSDTDLVDLLCEPSWFERAETLALTGLEGDCTVETFDAQVMALGAPDSRLRASGEPASGNPRSNAWRLPAASPAEVLRACPNLLSHALDQMFCAYSLWWSSGSDRVAPSFLTCQGLPPPEGFSALLAGDWSRGDWWELARPGLGAARREEPCQQNDTQSIVVDPEAP